MRNGQAALIAERVNVKLISGFAARRALLGRGQGERAAAGAARQRAELVELVEAAPGGGSVQPARVGFSAVPAPMVELTRPGFTAARRRLPPVLAALPELDAHRLAAEAFATACEKLGSMAGASAEGVRADGGAATNDGGVTTRVRYAATVAKVRAVTGPWPDPLRPGNTRGARRAITAHELVTAVCVEGLDMKAILIRAGWSGQRRDGARLTHAFGLLMEGVALKLGYLSPGAVRRFDT